jgi:hypothetical protein
MSASITSVATGVLLTVAFRIGLIMIVSVVIPTGQMVVRGKFHGLH